MSFLALLAALAAPQSATTVEVPFRIADSAIVVDAKVNGHDATLMFDTGFAGTVLLDSSLDVGPSTGTMTLRDFVGEIGAKTVKLNSLQVGSQILSPDEKLIVQQPGNFSAAYGQHVDGILGLGALVNKVTQINFEKKQFVFYPSTHDITSRPIDNQTSFLAKMLPIGGNSIELQVLPPSGQPMILALDTGNAFYATTHKDVLERVGLWDPSKQPKFIRQSGVASGAVDSWSLKMPHLNIFGVPVQSTVWDIIDLPSSSAEGDGTVGFGFLRNFNITFDYVRRRVLLEKWKTPVENDTPGDVGLSAFYNPRTKRTVVRLVSPDSPAAQAGIKEGDEILSVGSTDLAHPSYQELRSMLEGPIGSTVQLAISRDGALRRFTLKRTALYNE